jgi:hypothetical protein
MPRQEIPRSTSGVASACRGGVEGGLCGEATLAHHARAGLREGGRRARHPLVSSGEHPGAGARARPGAPPQLPGPCGQGPHAVVPPLARSHADQQAVGGNGRDLELGPLPQAPSPGRDHPQAHPSGGVDDQGHQRADVLWTQHDGQVSAVPGPNARPHRPWSLSGDLRNQAEPLEGETDGTLRALRLSEQSEKGLAALLRGDLVRGAPVVSRERRDGLAGTWWGPGGESPPRQVFAPTVPEGSHGQPPVHGGHDLSQQGCVEQEDTGSLRGAKEGTHARTATGHTSILPRSGFVPLVSRGTSVQITCPSTRR